MDVRLTSLRTNLTLDKTDLALYKRRLISADDPRPSAAYMGYSAAVILTMIGLLIVSIDIPLIISYFDRHNDIEPEEEIDDNGEENQDYM